MRTFISDFWYQTYSFRVGWRSIQRSEERERARKSE